MIDHISLTVSDFAKSRAFYLAALEPLGMGVIFEMAAGQGDRDNNLAYFGKEGPLLGIADGKAVGKGTHVAFRAEARDVVDAFYAAAIAAGGTDNGPPGIRAIYGPDYYAAFVYDPDGINVEAACNTPA